MDFANIPLDQPECKLRSTINKLVSEPPNAQQSWLPRGSLDLDDLYTLTHSRFPDELAELDALRRELDALITGDRSAFPSVYSFTLCIGSADLSRTPTVDEQYELSDEKHIHDLEQRIAALRGERLARRKLQHAPAQAHGAPYRSVRRAPRARRTRRVVRTAAKGTDPPGEPPAPRRPSIRDGRCARTNWSAR